MESSQVCPHGFQWAGASLLPGFYFSVEYPDDIELFCGGFTFGPHRLWCTRMTSAVSGPCLALVGLWSWRWPLMHLPPPRIRQPGSTQAS